MTTLQKQRHQLAALDALSRTRALTLRESYLLERLIKLVDAAAEANPGWGAHYPASQQKG